MPERANDVLRGKAAGGQALPRDPVRALQWKLYRAAKQSRSRRFHALYDKVCRRDVLNRAWLEVARNGGAPGVDGVTIEAIETSGVSGFLEQLQAELVEKRYRPLPVRRVTIPKRTGGERHLGVPTVTAECPAFWRVFGCGADCSSVPCAVRPSGAGVVRQTSWA
jgi:hypothetical protein